MLLQIKSNKKLFFSEESFSTYHKQTIKFNPKHKITTFLSYDFQEEKSSEMGTSSFYNDASSFTSNIFKKHQDFIFYNTYIFSISNNLQFELESDLNYGVDKKKLLLNSSDTLFRFTVEDNENFIVEQLQNRFVFSSVFLPQFRYRINAHQDVSIYFQYQGTLLKDDSILFQDLEDSTFNTNSSRSFIRYDSGVIYKLKKDKFELLIKPSYTTFESNDLNSDRNGAYNFLVRYRYNFSNYLSLINSLNKSFNRFSNDQLFQSVSITDNRNYILFDDIEMPSFVEWNISSTFRYLNTANGKMFFVHFNNSNSSQSLIPKILISNNSQKTIYITAGSVNQFRVDGFLRFPLLKNNMTTRFNFNKTSSFIADETGIEDLTSKQYILSTTFRSEIKENTKINLSVGFNAISQRAGLIDNSFTTIIPEIEVQQFIKPNFWLEIRYQPLIRIGLINQQLINFSISTKFLKNKLNLKLTFSDILNFNNPKFITRLISSNAINENITNRVGGYINLSVNYQFQ